MASAVEKNKTSGSRLRRWFDFTIYKKPQGKRVRQLTAAAIVVLMLLACGEIMGELEAVGPWWQYGVPGGLALVGFWLTFRIVNNTRFADFLIATEAEMNKVSWSTKKELKSATIVVLVLTLTLTAYLFLADRIWETILKWIGVLHLGGPSQEKTAALLDLIGDAVRWV